MFCPREIKGTIKCFSLVGQRRGRVCNAFAHWMFEFFCLFYICCVIFLVHLKNESAFFVCLCFVVVVRFVCFFVFRNSLIALIVGFI